MLSRLRLRCLTFSGGWLQVASQSRGLETSLVVSVRTVMAVSLPQAPDKNVATASLSSPCSVLTSAFFVLARHEI